MIVTSEKLAYRHGSGADSSCRYSVTHKLAASRTDSVLQTTI